MMPEIQVLFDQLASPSREAQDEAALCLALLLERHVQGRRDDRTHRLALPDLYFQLELMPEDSQELFTALCSAVLSKRLPMACRAALAGALATCGRIEGVEAALRVLGLIGASLDDTSAYSMMACITPALFSEIHRETILESLAKHKTEHVLSQLEARGSNQLVDIIGHFRKAIVELHGTR